MNEQKAVIRFLAVFHALVCLTLPGMNFQIFQDMQGDLDGFPPTIPQNSVRRFD